MAADGATDDILDEGREREERRTRDRSGKKKTRRGRRRHRKTAATTTPNKASPVLTAGGAEGEGEGQGGNEHTEEPIQNHVHHLPETATAAVATRGDGVGVANLPPVSRVEGESRVPDGTRGTDPSQGRKGGREKGRVRTGSSGVVDFRMVRIKQEPKDDDDVESGRLRASDVPGCHVLSRDDPYMLSYVVPSTNIPNRVVDGAFDNL